MIKVYNIIDQCLSLSNTLKALIIFKYIQFGKDKCSMEDLRSKSYKTQREFCAEIVDIQNILTWYVFLVKQAPWLLYCTHYLITIKLCLNLILCGRQDCVGPHDWGMSRCCTVDSLIFSKSNIEFKKKKCDELVEELHTMAPKFHQCLFTNVPIYFRNRFVDHRLFSGRCRNFIII